MHVRWAPTSCEEFFSSIPYIYESTPASCTQLRTEAVGCARWKLKQITENQKSYAAWRKLCVEVPDFTSQFLHELMNQPIIATCKSCQGQVKLWSREMYMYCECDDVESRGQLRESWFGIAPKTVEE
jgi:hypothetical protein